MSHVWATAFTSRGRKQHRLSSRRSERTGLQSSDVEVASVLLRGDIMEQM